MHWSEEQYAAYMAQQAPRMPQEPSTPQGDTQGNDMPEGVLLGKVRRLALDNGFLFYHTYSSRKSEPGFMDCAIAKPGHDLYLWELKAPHGKLTREQQRWLAFLAQCTGVQAACYRPSDLPLMTALLTRRSTPDAS